MNKAVYCWYCYTYSCSVLLQSPPIAYNLLPPTRKQNLTHTHTDIHTHLSLIAIHSSDIEHSWLELPQALLSVRRGLFRPLCPAGLYWIHCW